MIHNHEVPGSIPGPATEEQGTASRSSLFFVTFHDPQKGTDSLFCPPYVFLEHKDAEVLHVRFSIYSMDAGVQEGRP